MKAMILAAGMGERLKPLTLVRPKALMPVGNRPVIDRIIEYLEGHGFRELTANAHHLSDRLEAHIQGLSKNIRVLVEPEILGTAGGVQNAREFMDGGAFVVINGDILTDIDLSKALKAHRAQDGIVTLILHNHGPFNKIIVKRDSSIAEIPKKTRQEGLAFTGIHVMDPAVFEHIPEEGFSDIVECYRRLLRKGLRINSYVSEGHYWRDIGTPASYLLANKEALGNRSVLQGRDCRIADSAVVEEWAVIGDNCIIEEGTLIKASVLWENARIRKGTRVIDSIVTSSKDISTDVQNDIV